MYDYEVKEIYSFLCLIIVSLFILKGFYYVILVIELFQMWI